MSQVAFCTGTRISCSTPGRSCRTVNTSVLRCYGVMDDISPTHRWYRRLPATFTQRVISGVHECRCMESLTVPLAPYALPPTQDVSTGAVADFTAYPRPMTLSKSRQTPKPMKLEPRRVGRPLHQCVALSRPRVMALSCPALRAAHPESGRPERRAARISSKTKSNIRRHLGVFVEDPSTCTMVLARRQKQQRSTTWERLGERRRCHRVRGRGPMDLARIWQLKKAEDTGTARGEASSSPVVEATRPRYPTPYTGHPSSRCRRQRPVGRTSSRMKSNC